jgi:hypothetical protein
MVHTNIDWYRHWFHNIVSSISVNYKERERFRTQESRAKSLSNIIFLKRRYLKYFMLTSSPLRANIFIFLSSVSFDWGASSRFCDPQNILGSSLISNYYIWTSEWKGLKNVFGQVLGRWSIWSVQFSWTNHQVALRFGTGTMPTSLHTRFSSMFFSS